MKHGRRTAALFLLAAAIGLAALGQFYFFHRQEYRWDGLFLHSLAVLFFVLAWRQARIRRPDSSPTASDSALWQNLLRLVRDPQGRPIPTALLCSGLVLSLASTWLSQTRSWDEYTGDVIGLWLLGIGAVVLSAAWPTSSLPSALRGWKASLRSTTAVTWIEIMGVAGLTAVAFGLRAAALDTIPFTVGGDEAWHGLLARQVLQHELQNPFVMGYMSMPTFFYWPLSWSLRLVGDNVAGLRLPAALAGAITVPILYAFARRLWGRKIAFLAALFLATYDYHIHYSRLGANNVWDPLFVLLTLWLLDLGLGGYKSGSEPSEASSSLNRTRFCILAGLVMGVSVYFYTGARLLPPLMVTYVVFVWIKSRRQHRPGASSARTAEGPGPPPSHPNSRNPGLVWPLLMLALAFLVAAGPMISYALSHPDEWNARINQVGIVQSGWLGREPEITGDSTLHILAEQFLRAAGAFHVFPDRTVWYGADRPLLGFLPGIFAILGMAWALIRWQERRYFLLLIWFWSVIITGGMLTESPPSSQRLVIAIPAVSLLVAVGLERTITLGRRLLRVRSQRVANAALAILAVLLAVGSLHFYFVDFTPSDRYGSGNGRTATLIGRYLRDLDRHSDGAQTANGWRAYFFGAPRIYWSFGTMSFLAPGVPGEDVVEPITGDLHQRQPTFVEEGQKAVFLFLPERVDEARWVQEAYPGGTLREVHSSNPELVEGRRLQFVAYEVER